MSSSEPGRRVQLPRAGARSRAPARIPLDAAACTRWSRWAACAGRDRHAVRARRRPAAAGRIRGAGSPRTSRSSGARTLYGATKLAAELLIEEYRATYGLRAVVNRCGVVAGPWQMGKVDQGVFTYWMLAPPLRAARSSYIGYGGAGQAGARPAARRRPGRARRRAAHRSRALGRRHRERRRRSRDQPLAARDDGALPQITGRSSRSAAAPTRRARRRAGLHLRLCAACKGSPNGARGVTQCGS